MLIAAAVLWLIAATLWARWIADHIADIRWKRFVDSLNTRHGDRHL